MPSENKIRLLQDFYAGTITEQELKSLFVWLNSEKGNLEYEMLSNEKWLSGNFETFEDIDSSALFKRIEARIQDKKRMGRKLFLIKLRNAAAIFILGLLLPLTYFTLLKPQNTNEVSYLTASLSNEKVKELRLPDGTDVWLMSGSTISYPSSFSGSKTRNVEVKGQAFFHVAKDTSHPFILNLGEVGLKVVGTSFNVMNYGDEDHINVALKTGRVDLFKGTYNPGQQVVKMVQGQMVTYDKENPGFHVADVNVDKYTSWINGVLQFQSDPFPEVLKKLGRWYNISIKVKSAEVSDFPFTASIRKENLEQVVELLRFSTPFKYSIVKKDGMTQLIIE
ncbi:FecR domain-containing protein [uncultured Sunxiuqinia sp.]|uniref:FecR family protein n=1 Tax=uncultured Sunxiuqinia sp. TaxID=1573825 RepID=UPI002AA8F3BF|nr:FecR domain-containing protein [uncultured Sunxiuqinia sp.]